MSCMLLDNGTRLSLTPFSSHVGKGSNTQDVGDLMSKMWMSDVVAVGKQRVCVRGRGECRMGVKCHTNCGVQSAELENMTFASRLCDVVISEVVNVPVRVVVY